MSEFTPVQVCLPPVEPLQLPPPVQRKAHPRLGDTGIWLSTYCDGYG